MSMVNGMNFADTILDFGVEGFHRYSLGRPAQLAYVSRSLCELLGCSAGALLEGSDGYAQKVHPEDQAMYRQFLESMARQEAKRTVQYRLLRADGRVIHVLDTMFSRCCEGTMQGFSTLADVTDIRRENEALHALSETVPCGIVKYTCEETPKVTYVNDRMLRMLRFDPDDPAQLQLCRQSIFSMIPPEDRPRFRRFLDRVCADEHPIAGEISAMCCDGSRIRLYGWISRCVNSDGEEEFQSVCMDVTERYERKRRQEEQGYLRALSQVYDEICEIDPGRHSVRFLQGRYYEKLGTMAQMPLVLEDTARHWVQNVVLEEDRERVLGVFEVLARGGTDAEDCPVQMDFRIRGSDGSARSYIGIFLRREGGRWLFCARNVTKQTETEALKLENDALRSMTERMRELVMRFTDGMVAFEICGERVRPMYISSNVCRFFGYDQQQWLESMQGFTPIREFVSRCHISYDDFLELLENRESEFQYTDLQTGGVRRMKAICTARDSDGRCHVVLHDVTDAAPEPEATADVFIRTFGYFDVFVNGTPIAFRNEKAKELFALLVDRRGGFVTSGEAISLLWEDEPANAVTLARYRKVALRLKNTLEEQGVADVMESVDGKRRIVTQRVRCDLYDYLAGDRQLFKGSYLQNYSWGEMTLAELSD